MGVEEREEFPFTRLTASPVAAPGWYHSDWQTVVFHWPDLEQIGWGTLATFDTAQLRAFEWNLNTVVGSPLTFDVWVDDLSFTVD